MGDGLSDDEKLLVRLSAENIRWLYDVRDKMFRFYLLFVAAVVGAIKLTKLEVSAPEFLLLLVVFLVVTYSFANQIVRQRRLIDGERALLRSHLIDLKTPALFYEATEVSIWNSTTFGYLRILLLAFAVGSFFLPLPVLARSPLAPEYRFLVQLAFALVSLIVGWCLLRRRSRNV